jgi:hypothetical protein
MTFPTFTQDRAEFLQINDCVKKFCPILHIPYMHEIQFVYSQCLSWMHAPSCFSVVVWCDVLGGIQPWAEPIPWGRSIHAHKVLGRGKETEQTKQCSLH